MTGREIGLLLAGVLGLSVALACYPATAALVVGDQPPSLGGQPDNLLQSLASEVLASAEMAGPSALAGAGTAPSQDEQEEHPSVQFPEGLLPGPASGCSSNSFSQSSGSGSGNPAITGQFSYPPQGALETGLPREPRTILPLGPPFELLRPPQVSS